MLDSIETATVLGLRDRALIGLMTYTFARVGAALAMRVEDFYVQGRRAWVRLHEKGGKRTEIPAHHKLADYVEQYIAAAGIADDRKGPLFRGLSGRALGQSDVYRMVRRRAAGAGIATADLRVSQLPGDGHYGIFKERRPVGNCAADGRSRVGSDHGIVRPAGG